MVSGEETSVENWATGLILGLLETTYGQWMYRNLVVYDEVSGALVNKKGGTEEIKLTRSRQW